MSESAAFDDVLADLAREQVRFVLIGGFALNAWGVVRGTRDVDIVVDLEADNVARLAELVSRLHGQAHMQEPFLSSSRGIAHAISQGDRVLIETRIGPIDVVQGLPGVPSYGALRARAVDVEIAGVTVAVCALEDLRAMKRAAGRTRDLADLEDLDAAQGPA